MLKNEISKHKKIKVGACQWLRVYCRHTSFWYRVCCWNSRIEKNRLTYKLYEKGNQRLEDEVNMVNIVKTVRKLEALA